MKFLKPKKTITRGDGEKYLVRKTLFECSLFAIKIHKILKSDDDCLHDHPWSFVSILLKGSYVEHTPDKGFGALNVLVNPDSVIWTDRTRCLNTKSKRYRAGNILFRPASHIHRLEIVKPVTSLVITFKKIREWGFFTKFGWTRWDKYDHKSMKCD